MSARVSLPQRFPYRLVATDLDGTLLRGDGTISQRTRDALAAAQAAGAEHLVATGRSVAWTRDILRALGYRGIAVCGQGAQLYHAGEDRLLTSITLDRAVARRAVELLEDALGPLAVGAAADGVDGDIRMDAHFRPVDGDNVTDEVSEPQDVAPDREGLFAEPVIKLYLQHPSLRDDAFAAAARERLGGVVDFVVSGPGLVEMLPLGLSKATGLSLAARRLGVRASDTIAFGDMPNDVTMLGWAAHGVAMGNAHPEVLAVADEVTGSNDEDGIATVIEALLAASP
ncbi:HAD family hydrolase [Streptomyces avicenniae]|uniref:HAD family hydrolase n=1 Tax=Streptomyces avicenniae TaxID=500153 RepID=UPI000B006077|nr:HAD family hydrolase [Streptomyces avicenniae]